MWDTRCVDRQVPIIGLALPLSSLANSGSLSSLVQFHALCSHPLMCATPNRYVDREAPDIDMTPAEVRSAMRVKIRKMLREAQIAGALDEVEMLQLQISELDKHR